MRSQSHKEIVEEYSVLRGSYEDCLNYVENTVKNIIKSQSINVHEIIGRVKTEESLSGKVKRKDYSNLAEITDLCGIRIITYFSDDVDKIAELISQEFKVDVENTIDKRKSEDPTKFGYVSLHYVVSLKEENSSPILYSRFKNMKLELQIRTVMQHAWAEIEHDLGYKSKEDIPDKYRRQFSILAGLIELADDNFVQLKNNIINYEREVKEKLANLKRGFSVIYTKVENSDKHLVLINAHLDAYDKGNSGKKAQMKQLLEFIDYEYKKGNYVLVGADFNQSLKTLTQDEINVVPKELWRAENLDKSMLPAGFNLVYDESKNSARLNNKPYVKDSEGTYGFIIDGYIASDNIEVLGVETLNQEYRYSDHNPVKLRYKLK